MKGKQKLVSNKHKLMQLTQLKTPIYALFTLEDMNRRNRKYEYVFTTSEKELLNFVKSTEFEETFPTLKTYLLKDSVERFSKEKYHTISKERYNNLNYNYELENLVIESENLIKSRYRKYNVLNFDFKFFIQLIDTKKMNPLRNLTINQIYNEDFNTFMFISQCCKLNTFYNYYVKSNTTWIENSRRTMYKLYCEEILFIKTYYAMLGHVNLKPCKPKQLEFELFV